MCFRVCVCSQQDAQEFLISLLEGLQDDLNRVRDKNKKRHIDSSSEVETIRHDDLPFCYDFFQLLSHFSTNSNNISTAKAQFATTVPTFR